MATRLPFEIHEAVVAICGKAFWLKDPLRAFMRSAGVPAEAYDRYPNESKFNTTRHVLADLDALGGGGFHVQRRLVTELARLRPVVPNTDLSDFTMADLWEAEVPR